MDLGPDQAILPHGGIFPLLEPQRGAADEAALQLLGIAGILQAQPVERGLHPLDAARQQLAQKFGHAASVNPADAPVDELS